MAERIHINLTEDVESELIQNYQAFCDEVSGELKKMIGEAEKICHEVRYEPVTKAVNATVKIFNEEIHQESEKVFIAWLEGEGSFTAAMRNAQAGDDAIQTAKSLEKTIEECFNGFWQGKPMGDEFKTSTDRPKINDNDFEQLKDLYKDAGKSVKECCDNHRKELKQRSSEDKSYAVILPAIEAIGTTVEESFATFSKKIAEAKQQSGEIEKQQRGRDEQAAQQAEAAASKAADPAAALGMFGELE